MHDWALWDNPTDFHHNAIFSVASSGCTETGSLWYNNYVYGDTGATETGMFHTAANANSTSDQLQVTIFNNLVAVTASTGLMGGNGAVTTEAQPGGNSLIKVYNNTFVGIGEMQCLISRRPMVRAPTSGSHDLRNNLCYNWATQLLLSTTNAFASPEDYNLWNTTTGGSGVWDNNGTGYSSLSTWQAACSCETNGTVGAPAFVGSGSYHLANSTSAAWGKGVNLTSLGITQLNTSSTANSSSGLSRPASGSWDIGAYFDSGAPPPQAATPVCSPSSGAPPQTVSCTFPSSGSIGCWSISTIPATNGPGASTCATGTLYSGSISITVNPTTLKVISGGTGSTARLPRIHTPAARAEQPLVRGGPLPQV